MRAEHLHSGQGVNATTPSRFFTPPPQPPPLHRTATLPNAVQTCAPPSFVHYLTARVAPLVPAFGVGTLPPSLPAAPPAFVNAHVLCPPLGIVRGRFTTCTPNAPARLLQLHHPARSLLPCHPHTPTPPTPQPPALALCRPSEHVLGFGFDLRAAMAGPTGLVCEKRATANHRARRKKRSDDGRLASTIPSCGSGVWGGRACAGIMALLARVGGPGGG